MYKIVTQIEGIAPLLFGRMTEQEYQRLIDHVTGQRPTTAEDMEEAKNKVWRNSQGLFAPDTWIKNCMLTGCRLGNVKMGARSFWAYLNGGVFIEPSHIPFGKEDFDYMDDQIGRRPPKTGAACPIRRPAINAGWKLDFGIAVMSDDLPAENIRRSLDVGGLLNGIGSGRPRFGRFQVLQWEVGERFGASLGEDVGIGAEQEEQ